MKQNEDVTTIDMFNAPLVASHYQPVRQVDDPITGNRWAHSKTPDRIRDSWSTPLWLFNYLNTRYGPFNIDGAASASNAKCERYFSLGGEDAFFAKVQKGDNIFLNPPFSHMDPWIELARKWEKQGAKVTVICPGDHTTAWALNGLVNAAEIIHVIGSRRRNGKFASGRIAFVNADTGKEVSGNNKGTFILHLNPNGKASRTLYLSKVMMEESK